MIRVIKRGFREFIKQTACPNCAAVIEYTTSEVKERHGKDYSGGSDGCEYIKCPDCSKEIILKSW